MSLFVPDYIFKSIDCIDPQFLRARGIRALVLDVDNTLTAHGSQHLAPHVEHWLQQMRQAGVEMRICSNNFEKRVRPFAEKIGLPFVSFSLKPASRGLRLARRVWPMIFGRWVTAAPKVYRNIFRCIMAWMRLNTSVGAGCG